MRNLLNEIVLGGRGISRSLIVILERWSVAESVQWERFYLSSTDRKKIQMSPDCVLRFGVA